MKYIFCFFLVISGINSFAQIDLDSVARSIEEEAKMLYRSEMASWYGTDLFVEKYAQKRSLAGGYFSYTNADKTTCVFFSKEELPKIIASFTFDETFNVHTAIVSGDERELTKLEKDIFSVRKAAFDLVNSDTLFKVYQNTNLNLIPVVYNGEKRVYILSGASVTGLVVLGNDYLISFNNENKIANYRTLHKNIIKFNYYKKEKPDDEEEVIAAHTHLPETGDFILATDICTIMLYSKFAKWKQHFVISENYVSMWDCKKNKLTIITREAWDKINKN